MNVHELIKKLEAIPNKDLEVIIDVSPMESDSIIMVPVLDVEQVESICEGESYVMLTNSIDLDKTLSEQVKSEILPK